MVRWAWKREESVESVGDGVVRGEQTRRSMSPWVDLEGAGGGVETWV